MLHNTRVTGKMDMQRMGEALKRPGMDTRCWLCIASVKKFVLDEEHGPYADVVILSSLSSVINEDGLTVGDEDTVRVGSFYAGPNFGLYAPLDVDDEVLVAYPEGDPRYGGVVVSRLWSRSDPPPATANNNKSDFVLHTKDKANVRIGVTGGGKVLLGEAGAATKSVNREGDAVDIGSWSVTIAAGAVAAINVIPPGGGLPVTIPTAPAVAALAARTKHGSDKVEASD